MGQALLICRPQIRQGTCLPNDSDGVAQEIIRVVHIRQAAIPGDPGRERIENFSPLCLPERYQVSVRKIRVRRGLHLRRGPERAGSKFSLVPLEPGGVALQIWEQAVKHLFYVIVRQGPLQDHICRNADFPELCRIGCVWAGRVLSGAASLGRRRDVRATGPFVYLRSACKNLALRQPFRSTEDPPFLRPSVAAVQILTRPIAVRTAGAPSFSGKRRAWPGCAVRMRRAWRRRRSRGWYLRRR